MTKIEWTEETWNPITGCNKISPGCKNCYAEVMTKRLQGMGQIKYVNGFDEVKCHEKELIKPYKWKKPRKVFVCSMSDLFHEDVPDEFILKVFLVMSKNPQHTFQVLTKRPERMKRLVSCLNYKLNNVWLGVTAENQEQANERIPLLLSTPATKRFVSIEPMLGAVDLFSFNSPLWGMLPQNAFLNWVIVGGESGSRARPMHPDWVRSLRDQCAEASVPFFFKQWGEWGPCSDYKSFEEIQKNRERYQTVASDDNPPLSVDKIRMMEKVGKKKAGCLLDGIEYKEVPGV